MAATKGKTARTANGYRAEHVTGDYWFVRELDTSLELVKIQGDIAQMTYLVYATDPTLLAFTRIASGRRYYTPEIGKPCWHITDQVNRERPYRPTTPYMDDVREIFTAMAENHAETREV